ncbi:hypothetical protein HA117_20510 [Acinetobacter baumannii]|uniref:hypothetical protein n=1 Tax=Acinetobacter TaxID=469 RepID=UPI0014073F99|nr:MULTISPECIES: hypothetical protein [Acinetobacter]MDO5543810.1 hypothetical protein [Acinetobacter sp.]MDV4269259.1 hypothetical protein [Acinetobacter baumannii]NHP04504.1 hypothetical protein [Acinetobacter baumannii]NHP55838.1 hypothetical protein [Acinetobacter baumannii]NHP86431.1 hypothetical protein [Acinetobacter baumannii]
MKKLQLAILCILCLLVGAFLGSAWQKFYYQDICLDLGGGQQPGNHPICVIEQQK